MVRFERSISIWVELSDTQAQSGGVWPWECVCESSTQGGLNTRGVAEVTQGTGEKRVLDAALQVSCRRRQPGETREVEDLARTARGS